MKSSIRINRMADNEAGYYELADDWGRMSNGPADTTSTTSLPSGGSSNSFDWNRLTSQLIDVYRQKEQAKAEARARRSNENTLVTIPKPSAGGIPPLALLAGGVAVFLGVRALMERRGSR